MRRMLGRSRWFRHGRDGRRVEGDSRGARNKTPCEIPAGHGRAPMTTLEKNVEYALRSAEDLRWLRGYLEAVQADPATWRLVLMPPPGRHKNPRRDAASKAVQNPRNGPKENAKNKRSPERTPTMR